MARCCTTRSATPDADSRCTPKEGQLGNYQVIAPLARGGTAGVYLAEHGDTGERVALKVLDPFFCENAELGRRLLAERAISERVRHAGLLDVRLADRSAGGVPYLVMEYLDGESLDALADRGELDRDTLVAVATQVAAALHALHAAGFVHCDVKPSNVFVLSRPRRGGRPRIKLIDFGGARRIDEPVSANPGIAGTPAYMAPEQWRGEPVPASDVYSLGCMLYELATGQPVFSGTLPYLRAAHCHRQPRPPSEHRPDLPPELERVIVRALAKNPALRPSAAELVAELACMFCVAEPLGRAVAHALRGWLSPGDDPAARRSGWDAPRRELSAGGAGSPTSS
jgi:serine/threonine-protein kinase